VGELGDFVTEAMQPSVTSHQCRNCNLNNGPRIGRQRELASELGIQDIFTGTTTRVNAKVDFGITSSGVLAWAHSGLFTYAGEPYPNLRPHRQDRRPELSAHGVKADSGITDLSQIAAQKLRYRSWRRVAGQPTNSSTTTALTQEAVASWGGSFENAFS